MNDQTHTKQDIRSKMDLLNHHMNYPDGSAGWIEFEGMKLVKLDKELENGDTYYAARNTEQLLTAKNVDRINNWVVPVEIAYSFDIWECTPVRIETLTDADKETLKNAEE